MISGELKEILSVLDAQGKMKYLEGATEKVISEFENKNNCKLPDRYKEWLQYSDGGECFLPAGVQFYGVGHKPNIDVDDNNRPNNKYVVIGALATGDPILFEKGGERVAIFNKEAGRIEDDEIYENFFDFLKDLYDILGIGG